MRDPWRYRCPNKHTSWQSRNTNSSNGQEAQAEYYCEHCGPFDELVDMKAEP